MKKHMKYICAAICVFLLPGCSKEIGLPYRSIESLYVVEGRITDETAEIIVTRTQDMNSAEPVEGTGDAIVTITDDDGIAYTFRASEEEGAGYVFRPSGNFSGEVGKTYVLSVIAGGREFVSASTMHDAVNIEKVAFNELTIMNQEIIILSTDFKDIENEDNYYCYRLYKNREYIRSGLMKDTSRDGQTLKIQTPFMPEGGGIGDEEKTEEEKNKDGILREGDEIEIEIQTIDRRAYDYLYSLSISSGTSANPIENFTGGCLGYFSAYSSVKTAIVFNSGSRITANKN